MAKVTSKLQVTLPKRIAEKHGIAPGDEIEFQSAGDVIRILPAQHLTRDQLDRGERLRLFDEASKRSIGTITALFREFQRYPVLSGAVSG